MRVIVLYKFTDGETRQIVGHLTNDEIQHHLNDGWRNLWQEHRDKEKAERMKRILQRARFIIASTQ